MKTHPHLYPARDRSFNVELIKNTYYANSEADYDCGLAKLIENMHPSLFAELDFMEDSIPAGQRERAIKFNDMLFLNNLEHILKFREVEFELDGDELFDEILENQDFYSYIFEVEPEIGKVLSTENCQSILEVLNEIDKESNFRNPERYQDLCRVVEQRLSQVKDVENLPLLLQEVFLNLVAYSLDHVSSRMRTKRFLREVGREIFSFNINNITSSRQIDDINKRVARVKANAKDFSLLAIVEVSERIENFLDKTNILLANKYEGEKAAGYGHCGHCSMLFCSSAIISFDSTCPYLLTKGETLHLPLGFNSATCPFCGTTKRIDTPAMFYRPSYKKVIYNIPVSSKQSKTEAENLYSELIAKLREQYKSKISPKQAEAFDKAGEEITYGMEHFLRAIQMGSTNRVWHAFLIVKLFDGTAFLLDKTTDTLIDLIDEKEVKQMWDISNEKLAQSSFEEENQKQMQIFNKAREAYYEKDFEKAKRLFMNIDSSNFNDSLVRGYLGSINLYLGE